MAIKPIILNTPENDIQSDAQDWAEIFNAIVGDASGVFDYEDTLSVNVVNDNTIQVLPGVYTMQGHILRVDDTTENTLTVESGTLGMNRIDSVIVEYVKSADITLNDTFVIKILKGSPVAPPSMPTAPTLVQQDLLSGGTLRQELLANLKIEGTILSVEPIVTDLLPTLDTLLKSNGTLSDRIDVINTDDTDFRKVEDVSDQFTKWANATSLQAIKTGNIVSLAVNTTLTAGWNSNIATAPVGLRPAADNAVSTWVIAYENRDLIFSGRIASNGSLTGLASKASNGTVRLTVVYIIGN